MESNRRAFSRLDALIVLGILLIALLFFIFRFILDKSTPDTRECSIILNNTIVKTVSLQNDQVFSISENTNVVFEVRNNAIAFTSSDCPDKVCVQTGFIKHNGQTAACLPNGIILKIVSNEDLDEDQIDVIAN